MNCNTVEKNSIAYLDGRLDPRHRREVEAHLAGCVACRARAQQFRELWGILDEAPALRPSPSFDAAVRMRIAQEPRRSGVWAWLAVPSPRLAVGVTALLVLSIWLSSLRPAAQAPPPEVVSTGDAEFRMIADLPVLEDYDVLTNFEALSELPLQQTVKTEPGT
jgi:anti-sigma factor RsiW